MVFTKTLETAVFEYAEDSQKAKKKQAVNLLFR